MNEKINLLHQIYEYNNKGYNLYKNYSINDDINELKFQIAILKEKERNLEIENKLKIIMTLYKNFNKNI